MTAPERWATRDAQRIARRYIHAIETEGWLDADELRYLRSSAMLVLTSHHLGTEDGDRMRLLLRRLEELVA